MAETKRTTKAAAPAAAREVKAAPVKETVKAAATEAAKAETKTAAVPAVKEETKAAPAPAIKAEAPAAAPAKKAPVKRTAKKEAVKKEAPAKKETPVKRAVTKKAAEPKTTVFFEFDGKQIIAKDVMDRAIKDFKSTHKDVEIKDFELYIVADEGAAYYVVNGEPSDDYKVML